MRALGSREFDERASETRFDAAKKTFAEMQVFVEIMLHNPAEFVQLPFSSFLNSCVLGSASRSNEASLEQSLELFVQGKTRSEQHVTWRSPRRILPKLF